MQGTTAFDWDGAASSGAPDFYHTWTQINQANYADAAEPGTINSIVMTSPAAGEVVSVGESVSITWTTT